MYSPVETYLQEADDLLAEVEESALTLSGTEPPKETVNQETVNRLFRAFHTIKGSGAMFGFDQVAGFTHHVETLLDSVRNGSVAVSPRLTELVLAAKDQIKALLVAEQGGDAVCPDSSESLIAILTAFSGAQSAPPGSPPTNDPTAQPCVDGPPALENRPPENLAEEKLWAIHFRPRPDLLACGGNPAALFKDLGKLGACEISALTDDIPPLGELQPDVCYLHWTVRLRTVSDRNAIEDVFIFVVDGSDLRIEDIQDAPDPLAQTSPSELDKPVPGSSHKEPAKGSTVREPTVREPTVREPTARESTVRVPAGRLDRLVNLVGEMVMNQSRLSQAALQNGAPELANPVQELERLVAELRDDVLGIRMLPIGTIFGRFRRLVHDLSAELGKEAELVTDGAETELDKSILDQLGEPLVHLLRNSIGHGIEPAGERIERGKPRRGSIRLTAAHTGSGVVIGIEDDGRGIDRAAVRAKAVAKQLIAPDASLTTKETLNLILLPGFSTAQEVTGLSGRGVGMDVVKRQIDALRGSMSIASEEGKGCRISLTLPLTLAIIEGLLVQIGMDRFVIPMAAITENVELHAAERTRNNGRNAIAVRGELIPYIDLRKAFRIEGDTPPIEKIVIVRHEDQRVGLVVDRVVGTHQTVIQSLGRFFRNIDVVSGATIMGDGGVALILSISAIVRLAESRDPATGEEKSGRLI